MIRNNSLETYYENVKPSLPKRQSDVLDALIKMGNGTIYQVAEFLKVFPNAISGRFSELEKIGKIESIGKITMPGKNRKANVWKPVMKDGKAFWEVEG